MATFVGKGLSSAQGSSLENSNTIESAVKIRLTGSALDPSEVAHVRRNTSISESGNEVSETETFLLGEKQPKSVPPVHFYALESEQRILELLRPLYVIVYDSDMAFVRELEVYKAMNQGRPLKVYFLLYEDSTEASRFESSIKKENVAFENLIRQKATMTIPVDQVLHCLLCLSR